MSSNNSPTKQRRNESLQRATRLVYDLKGAEYRDNLNPYPLNSAEHERFKKFYNQKRAFYHYMEGICDDLAEVYGEFRPDRLKRGK